MEIAKEITPSAYHEHIDIIYTEYNTNTFNTSSINTIKYAGYILDFFSKAIVLSLNNTEITSEQEKKFKMTLSSIMFLMN